MLLVSFLAQFRSHFLAEHGKRNTSKPGYFNAFLRASALLVVSQVRSASLLPK